MVYKSVFIILKSYNQTKVDSIAKLDFLMNFLTKWWSVISWLLLELEKKSSIFVESSSQSFGLNSAVSLVTSVYLKPKQTNILHVIACVMNNYSNSTKGSCKTRIDLSWFHLYGIQPTCIILSIMSIYD